MKLEKWALIAEIVGGIAIVASLIVLILEIRENTETQRLAAAQQVLGLSYSNNTLLGIDEDAGEILFTISAGGELSELQQRRYETLLLSFLASHWQVYYQYENGFLDQQIFDAYERRTLQIFENRYSREWWGLNKYRFSERYQDYVDGVLSKDEL